MLPHEATRFRGTAARIDFLAADRPDLQYASKETSRRMANPQNQDWELLKRVARYLISHRRLVHTYEWQDECPTVSVHTDSNWAGCLKTRKSTSGACLFNGTHGHIAYETHMHARKRVHANVLPPCARMRVWPNFIRVPTGPRVPSHGDLRENVVKSIILQGKSVCVLPHVVAGRL